MRKSTNLTNWLTAFSVCVLMLSVGLTTSFAQLKVRPGVMDTCYASTEVANTKVYAEHELKEMEMFRRQAEAQVAARMASPEALPPTKTAEFIVEYNGFTPEAEAAFQYAVDIWSTILVSDVPIRVSAIFRPLRPGVLGSAGTRNLFANFSDEVAPDTWYVSALADAIAGRDLNAEIDSLEDFPDIGTNFSSTFNWYYGTDLNPAPNQYDFVSVVLHELGHGLGFSGFATVNDSTEEGTVRFQYRDQFLPVIYSNFVEDSGDTSILAFPDPSVTLGNQLTIDDLFMTGENTVAAYNGQEPELFTPDVWNPGSSYSHWDEEAFPAGDSNSLMSPQFGFAEAIHDVGDITKGLFKDMGWTINEAPVALISLRHTAKASPGSACLGPVPTTDEIGVVPGKTVCLYYTVNNVGDVPLTLHSLEDTQSGDILMDVEQVLPPGASLTVTRQIKVDKEDLPLTNIATWTASTPGEVGEVSATAVAKLFYAPVAKISPTELISVEAQQGERKLRTLEISNLGGSPLAYRTVIRETASPFDERVATSQAAVAQLDPSADNSLRTWSAPAEATEDASGFAPIPYDGEALKVVQFATDFESFAIGPLGTQNGWVGTDDTLALISNENPFSGEKHLRMLSDSTKDNYSVFSPAIRGGSEPYSSFSIKLNLLDTGAQYRIFPSQLADGSLSIGAGILIAPTRAVAVFISGRGYVNTGYVLPERYVELKYVSSRFEGIYDLYIDDELIAEGISTFSSDVDVVEIRAYNAGVEPGVALDIDDIELIDGDAAAPDWVGVEPAADTVAVQTKLNADIVFDADRLRPGVYRAEITVLTNDPFNPSATIPVELTVTGRPGGTEALDLEKLVLVDAETDQVLKTLEDGDVYDLNELPDITVAAVPMDPHFKGSIAFYINGEFIQRERVAPYALAGDDPRGDYNPYNFTPGDYRLTAISTVATQDGGERIDSISVQFSITGDQSGVIALVDAAADRVIKTLENGDVLDLSQLPAITIAVEPTEEHFSGYVEFYINGDFIQRERIAPYALAGDDPRGDYNPYDFAPGDYMLESVLFTKEGERISSLYARFSVVEGSAAVAKTKLNNAKTSGISYEAYPNPVTRSFRVQTTSEAIAHYTLIDNLGRVLVANPVDNRSTLEVDMTPYLSKIRSAGIFYLKVITQSGHSETIRMRVE